MCPFFSFCRYCLYLVGEIEFLDVWDDAYAAIMRYSRGADGYWVSLISLSGSCRRARYSPLLVSSCEHDDRRYSVLYCRLTIRFLARAASFGRRCSECNQITHVMYISLHFETQFIDSVWQTITYGEDILDFLKYTIRVIRKPLPTNILCAQVSQNFSTLLDFTRIYM